MVCVAARIPTCDRGVAWAFDSKLPRMRSYVGVLRRWAVRTGGVAGIKHICGRRGACIAGGSHLAAALLQQPGLAA